MTRPGYDSIIEFVDLNCCFSSLFRYCDLEVLYVFFIGEKYESSAEY